MVKKWYGCQFCGREVSEGHKGSCNLCAINLNRVIDQTDWRWLGACVPKDDEPMEVSQERRELFFPQRGDQGHSAKRAKAICAECPVKLECLEYAVAQSIPHGVWGGMTDRERREYRRTQNRKRQRINV